MASEFDINPNPSTDQLETEAYIERERAIKEMVLRSGAPEEQVRSFLDLTDRVRDQLDGHTGTELASVVLSVVGTCIHKGVFGKQLTASLAKGILDFIQEKHDD